MKYLRMPIEIESPEQLGYDTIECNLAESSIHDAVFQDLKLDLNQLVLAYGHHLGKTELRELIASPHQNISAGDVLITAGAAAALFITATTLLDKKDHLIVLRPNYATNIETPKAIGCEIDFVDLSFEKNFEPDVQHLASLVKPNTRYISITNPHNPTGTVISKQSLLQLIELAEKQDCYLLVDETYRDLTFGTQLPLAASLSDKVVSVSSVSKAFGLPGIRIGWLITRNKKLQETFLAAKEQIFLCNSIVDEEIAYQFLKQKAQHMPAIRQKIAGNFEILKNWMETQSYLEWVTPEAGVICFPRLKKEIQLNMDAFYETLYHTHKTLVGPGHWFDMEKRYMRIGYGWPTAAALTKGLENITHALKEHLP
jgi:aspartate/methionine/tyrosine aminotransferase